MRDATDLFDYQRKAVEFQCARPESMLWLDMGLGKSVVTLTSISHLINSGFLNSVVIVAPIRVIKLVWRQEAVKWKHTKHLTFSMVTGSRDQRTRALLRPANIYLVNYENLKWLSETLNTYFIKKDKPLPFQGVVWDEISKMKNSSTKRVMATRKILDHLKWFTGLTGTPASNGYKDLHGQYLVVDKGVRLGTSKTAFKHRFYKKEGPYNEVAYEDTQDTIKKLISDITLEMSAEDYNPLPDLIVNDIEIELPENLRAAYEKMEKEFFLALDSGTTVEMFNKAALTNKCLQFSNGAVYPVAGMPLWEGLHDLKLDALEEVIDEAQGSPVLCSYMFRSDAERIMKRFEKIRPINLTACKSEASLNDAMARWAKGDCQLMIGHPACLGADTEVFTETRGWVSIVRVGDHERVFDGVEFVNHKGSSYSGFKEVIDVFGITMTPDHKLLIDGEWVEAENVRNNASDKAKAIFQWKDSPCGLGEVLELWGNFTNDQTKCSQKQSEYAETLQGVCSGNLPPYDKHSNLGNLARNDMEGSGRNRQELRRSGNHSLSRVERIQNFLFGYVRRVFRRSDNRTSGCKQTLLQSKLSMGNQYGTTSQQTNKSIFGLPGRTNPFSRIGQAFRFFKNNVSDTFKQRDDRGRSCKRLSNLKLWEKSETSEYSPKKKANVYDLVDCGPRHQFLIRNKSGEMFISHNSMGHGIDGLQNNGHILTWFGLTWSLDLYEQFNARIRRQGGKGVPIIAHRILIKDTLDQAQSIALSDKSRDEKGLRDAVKQYRMSKGV